MRIGLIGGTGSALLLPAARQRSLATPWGPPSGPLLEWREGAHELCFLHRHGPAGTIPPHRVNYRANVWAMHAAGVDWLIGINAVGGIHRDAIPGRLAFPDQLIDYSWGRAHSYEEGGERAVRHVDFTCPVDPVLHAALVAAAQRAGVAHLPRGVYGVTQGPRLETAAEIDRLERDGCDFVGMTAMPEAALARELGIDYAICAVVVNPAAGRGAEIHAEIERSLQAGIEAVQALLKALLAATPGRS